jgi:hypothetical protein
MMEHAPLHITCDINFDVDDVTGPHGVDGWERVDVEEPINI